MQRVIVESAISILLTNLVSGLRDRGHHASIIGNDDDHWNRIDH